MYSCCLHLSIYDLIPFPSGVSRHASGLEFIVTFIGIYCTIIFFFDGSDDLTFFFWLLAFLYSIKKKKKKKHMQSKINK